MKKKRKLPSRRNFAARYAALRADLHHRIQNGTIKPGQMLETETVLATRYNLSRASVRRVLKELIDAGLVRTIRGKGTVVLDQGNSQRSVIRLAMYIPVFETNQWRAALEAFSQEHPEIDVQLFRISHESYFDTLFDLFASGNGPDLVAVNASGIQRLAERIPLVDLNSALEKETKARSMHPAVRALFTITERLLAAPVFCSPIVLAYNKDALHQAGLSYPDPSWKWHDLLQIGQEFTLRHSETQGFALSTAEHRWPVFLLQNGVKLGPNGFPINHPRVIEAVKYVAQLLHLSPPVLPTSVSEGFILSSEDLFLQGHAAMTLTSYQAMNAFQRTGFNWDVTLPPVGKQQASLLLGVGLALSSNSSNREAALKLLRYLLRPEVQQLMLKHGTTVPSRRETWQDERPVKGVHPAGYYTFQALLDTAIPLNEAFPWLYRRALEEQLEQVWRNGISANEACRRAQERIDAGCIPKVQKTLYNSFVMNWIS